eukprot:TRINITY_DN1054_c0_g6_i2.p1 TRINITY_DN1054_c0_g6~~TRINITY_DN1054_c0_g6_i2.p1  ORF type:complete len:588 (+),score=163.03 TRINITY_DN1054_c0_g6_i2:19-1782(+)
MRLVVGTRGGVIKVAHVDGLPSKSTNPEVLQKKEEPTDELAPAGDKEHAEGYIKKEPVSSDEEQADEHAEVPIKKEPSPDIDPRPSADTTAYESKTMSCIWEDGKAKKTGVVVTALALPFFRRHRKDEVSRRAEIDCLLWSPYHGEPIILVAAGGRLALVNIDTLTLLGVFGKYTGVLRAMCPMPTSKEHVIVCNNVGDVQIFSVLTTVPPPSIMRISTVKKPTPAALHTLRVRAPVARMSVGMWPADVVDSARGPAVPLSQLFKKPAEADEQKEEQPPSEQKRSEKAAGEKQGKPAKQLRPVIAVGGKERDLTVWDVETGQRVFRACNVEPYKQLLARPIWISALQFVPNDNRRIAVGTSYSEFRMYKGYKRAAPYVNRKLEQTAVNCLEMHPSGQSAFFGSTTGEFMRVTIKRGQVVGGYHGVSGAIRSIAVHPLGSECPYVACCGLDRFLYVYHIFTRKLVHKVYIKQQCTSVLFSAEPPVTCPRGKRKVADEIWQTLADVLPEKPEDDDDDDDEQKSSDGGESDESEVEGDGGSGSEEDSDELEEVEEEEEEEEEESKKKAKGKRVAQSTEKVPAAKRQKTEH